jgi:hypothetical protein
MKMKKIILILALILALKNESFCQTIIDSLKIKAENNQNPSKWNQDLFLKDLQWLKNNNSKPLKSLAFPVEKYDTYDFTKAFNFKIDNFNFSGISIGENIGGKQDKMIFRHDFCLVFFTKDTEETIDKVDVNSRNSPYLTFQGTFKLKEQFDFVGVKSPDEKGFAMVSMKAFDLQFGQTIIIFPNENGSFYYVQVKEKPILNEDYKNFVERLKANNKLIEMLAYAIKK